MIVWSSVSMWHCLIITSKWTGFSLLAFCTLYLYHMVILFWLRSLWLYSVCLVIGKLACTLSHTIGWKVSLTVTWPTSLKYDWLMRFLVNVIWYVWLVNISVSLFRLVGTLCGCLWLDAPFVLLGKKTFDWLVRCVTKFWLVS